MTFHDHVPTSGIPLTCATRRRPQIRLITLLLVTACAAVWFAFVMAKREVTVAQSRLKLTRRLAHELVITDRTRLAVVKQDESYFDENVWHVFVPRDGMRMHLATEGIALPGGTKAQSEASAELPSGLHKVELIVHEIEDRWNVLVQVDMVPIIQIQKEKEWRVGIGSVGGAQFDRQAEFAAGEDAVLFERTFTIEVKQQQQPDPAGRGVKLWIEGSGQ